MTFRLILLLLTLTSALQAQNSSAPGTISGIVVDHATGQPVQSVSVVLRNKTTGDVVSTIETDARGAFILTDIPRGEYQLTYTTAGTDGGATKAITIDDAHVLIELKQLPLESTAIKMEKFEVKSKQDAFLNTIDRKVYNVGKEIQSATGSASDLLQNIPSIQVDIDGNVSLRGASNVTILIDGRNSTLMGKTRAEALQQLPADSIDKIEVITNPSAKYKPDGTGGIINITLKRKHDSGFSSTVTGSIGNEERYNAGFSTNYNPGRYNFFGNVSIRQDDRLRHVSDLRTKIDSTSGLRTTTVKKTDELSRPLTRIARAGVDYKASDQNKFGTTASYNHRSFSRRATDSTLSRDNAATVTGDYDRLRYDPEFEEGSEFTANYEHTFAEEDHTLNLEFKTSRGKEQEDNHYTNIFRIPPQAATYDNTLIKVNERQIESIVEYAYPIGEGSKFEAGYTLNDNRLDTDFFGEALNPSTGQWTKDVEKSNRFRHDETIHAFYATYAKTLGKFGFLAGLRPEYFSGESRLINTGANIPNDYSRVYPSLHLAYQLNDVNELQLNYSHRVNRPESDDLNPFPEYADPFNLRTGNPRLLPEDVHSIEAGYGFKNDNLSFSSTVYHRYLYHGFTSITRDIGGSVFLTTKENLAVSRSSGVELAATADVGKFASFNLSTNTFFNTIDASNLGYSSSKSDVSWTAKLSASVHLPQSILMQFNTNYTSTRLTPQGSRRPSFVANLGLRRDLWQKKAAVLLTVSDLFNSLKETTRIDTPILQEEIVRRRSARIVYIGVLYNFGKPMKKPKDEPLKFDNSL